MFGAIKIADAGTPEWHEARTKGLTGTDAAAILGDLPWRTPLQVWAEKVGEAEPEPIDPSRAEIGHAMEGAILDLYTARSGVKVDRTAPALYRHPNHSWMLGTPDAFAFKERGVSANGCIRSAPGVVEAKWANVFRKDEWSDGAPLWAKTQATHYACVLGLDWAAVAGIVGAEFMYEEFDTTAEARMEHRKRLGDWWKRHVLGGVAPEPTERDRRTLGKMQPENGATELDGQAQTVARMYLDSCDAYKKAETHRLRLGNALRGLLRASGSRVAVGGGIAVKWTGNNQLRVTEQEAE